MFVYPLFFFAELGCAASTIRWGIKRPTRWSASSDR